MNSLPASNPAINTIRGLTAALLVMFMMLAVGCGSGDGGSSPLPTGTSGIGVAGQVQAPNGALAKAPMTGKQWFASLFSVTESFAIDIAGWTGVSGATVRVFQIDDPGNPIGAVIATGTTNPDGSFALRLPSNTSFASNLIAQVENDATITAPMPVGTPNTLSVPIVSSTINLNPATDVATRALANRLEPLSNFTTDEVAQYLAVVETLVTENPPASANLAITLTQITAAVGGQMNAALTALSGTGAAEPAIITTSLPNGVQNSAYSRTVLAVGGTGTLSWTLDAGSNLLPAGLSLNPNTGRISGTPTTPVSQASFTLRVQDAASPTPRTDTQALSLTIAPAMPLTIVTTSLPAGTEGQAYNFYLQANGGTPGYVWDLVNGSTNPLPAGLVLNSTGVISGTPTVAGGPVTVTVSVMDNAAVVVTRDLSITINPSGPPPLVITTSSPLPTGTVGQPYNALVSATGGTPPYIWSGPMPAGLALDPNTGQITGTPTSPVNSTLTISVIDSGTPQQNAGQTFDIQIILACTGGFLTVTGYDNIYSSIQGNFCPTYVVPGVQYAPDKVTVQWVEQLYWKTEAVTIAFDNATGDVESIVYYLQDPLNTSFWLCDRYALHSIPCSGVTVDPMGGTVTIINTQVPLGGESVNTRITLNGALSYPPYTPPPPPGP